MIDAGETPVDNADLAEEGARFRGWLMLSNTGHGAGTLEVRSGRLQVRLGPLTARFLGAFLGVKRVATHQRRRVEVFCALVGPPLLLWRNTGVVVRFRGGSAVVVVAAWNRRRVLQRLGEAGFEVARRETWTDVGLRAVRPQR